MEPAALAATTDKFGIPKPTNAVAHLTPTGMDTAVSPALPHKHGTATPTHAHALEIKTGMASTVSAATTANHGTPKSMPAPAPTDKTGMELNASPATTAPTGMGISVSPAVMVRFGAPPQLPASAPQDNNGMEAHASPHATPPSSTSMESAHAPQEPSSKMETVFNSQPALQVKHGKTTNALPFNALQDNSGQEPAAPLLLPSPAPLVPSTTESAASPSTTTALLAHTGLALSARPPETAQSATIKADLSACPSLNNVLQD